MNVFLISNSTCLYFTKELYGLLAAAGHEDAVLAHVYSSGCSIQQHNEWLKEDATRYELHITDRNGHRMEENCSLRSVLNRQKWDVISFDNNAASFASGDIQLSLAVSEPHFGELFRAVQAIQPEAHYLWHEVWANEIGYRLAFSMKSVEQRTAVYRAKQGVMRHMMKTYGISGVPTGDAWEKVRDLPLITTPPDNLPEASRFTLASRVLNGAFFDDFSHDGDLGGGRYLNACVWFEILTGESCVRNTYRPTYTLGDRDFSLTEEKISTFQTAAHEAVAEFRAYRG